MRGLGWGGGRGEEEEVFERVVYGTWRIKICRCFFVLLCL